jgi:hypothetical protein
VLCSLGQNPVVHPATGLNKLGGLERLYVKIFRGRQPFRLCASFEIEAEEKDGLAKLFVQRSRIRRATGEPTELEHFLLSSCLPSGEPSAPSSG